MKVREILGLLRLYHPVKKTLNYLTHPQILRNDLDVQVDILKLTRTIASWKRDIWLPSFNTQNSRKNILIISMTNVPFLAKAHALLAIGLKEHGYHPIILCSPNNYWAQRYFSIFDVRDFVFWDKYIKDFSADAEYAKNIVEDFLVSNPEIQDFKMWQFHGVYVGKLALSSMIRRQLKGQLDLKNPSQSDDLRQWMLNTVNNVLIAEHLFDHYSIEKMVVRDAGYVPNGAIYEVGLNQGIDAIRFENAQMLGQWMVKRYNLNTRGQALFSLSPRTWQNLQDTPLTDEQDQALTNNFIERYNPDSKHDLYQYQHGKKQLSREKVISTLNLDPQKKTAVVFAHISWDANFFDGEDLFDDFEHWLVETVKIACQNSNLNWIVKLHPANVYKLQRENKEITEEAEMIALRRLGNLPEHIKIMPANTPINTWSLFPVIDYGLTVRGTIGMELPCFGIPVVTAGTGRYNGYGFTIDPPTRDTYVDCLLNLQHVPCLDSQQIRLARRHAYWVFLHRQASFDEFSKMSSQVLKDPNHPLHHNLQITTQSSKDFVQAPRFQAFIEWIAKGKEPDFMYHKNDGKRESA